MFHQLERQIPEIVSRHIAIRYGLTDIPVAVEQPRQTSFGELALPVAFQLAKPLRQNPKKIAAELVDELGAIQGVAALEVEPVSQDLVISILHGLEKHLWMLQAQVG